MPVKDADPRAAELDEAFARAMEAPSRPREAATPPEVDREAPHGRDADGQPLAPFGLTKDGRPKLSAGGRKPKDEQARVVSPQTAAAEAGADTPPPNPPADLLPGLMDATEGIWLGGTIVADVGPRLPLIGKLLFSEKMISGRKLSATMAAFDQQRPALASALNEAAQHDARARRLALRLAAGDVSWVLTVMTLTLPFASAVGAIWQGDKALAEQGLPGLDELARRNEQAMERFMQRIAAQALAAQQAQAEQLAELNGQVTADAA